MRIFHSNESFLLASFLPPKKRGKMRGWVQNRPFSFEWNALIWIGRHCNNSWSKWPDWKYFSRSTTILRRTSKCLVTATLPTKSTAKRCQLVTTLAAASPNKTSSHPSSWSAPQPTWTFRELRLQVLTTTSSSTVDLTVIEIQWFTWRVYQRNIFGD